VLKPRQPSTLPIVGPRGGTFQPTCSPGHDLYPITSWNVAGTPGPLDWISAARTADVQVCSANLAAVDTAMCYNKHTVAFLYFLISCVHYYLVYLLTRLGEQLHAMGYRFCCIPCFRS
jgi:hypothetical protein